jgi:hypothetical protein
MPYVQSSYFYYILFSGFFGALPDVSRKRDRSHCYLTNPLLACATVILENWWAGRGYCPRLSVVENQMSRKNKVLLFLGGFVLLAGFVVRSLLHTPQYVQVLPVAPAYSEALPADAQWLALFNGKDLQGWIPKITGQEAGSDIDATYRVEDGAITVNYDGYEDFDWTFGNLFYHVPFSYYVLRLEYRFIGEQATDSLTLSWAWRNSGVMIHSQSPQSMALDQPFPVSIEVQLLGAREGAQRSTANLCTPGSHVVLYPGEGIYTTHCTNSLSKSYPGDQWVQLEVEVWGSEKIRHFINGDLVLEYAAPQLDPSDGDAQALMAQQDEGNLEMSEGYIALQSESHPVQFRNIQLHPITRAVSQ